MTSSFGLEGETPGWVCLVEVSGWFRIGLSYPSPIALFVSSLYRLFSACCAAASVHHTYVGEDRRILASPCTGLSTDRSLFFLCPLSAPLLFKQVLRSTSLAGLPFRLGLGRVMDAIGYSSGLLAQFASCPYSDAILFSR